MEKIIELEDVTFAYDGIEVLNKINMSVPRGKMIGILGANGAGKTTLLKLICGLLSPDSGRVLFHNTDFKSFVKSEIAKRISYVPQNLTTGFPFTVSEVVLMGRAPYIGKFEFEREGDLEIAFKAMEAVGIAHLKDRLSTEISGGERQLTSLARAIAQDPEIMVLDEPATFLDIKHKTEIMGILTKQKEDRGLSIIAATHDIFSGFNHFDQLITLKDCEILAKGSKEEIINEEILKQVYGIEVTVKEVDGTNIILPV